MRVKFQAKATQADHLKHMSGNGIQHFHGAYGAGLGSKLALMAMHNLVIPGMKGAVAGGVGGLLSEFSGSYADKLKAAKKGAGRGALSSVVKNVLSGKRKGKASRPF